MYQDQMNSSSDEFDFSTLNEEITWICDGFRYETNESSGEDRDEVRDARRWKIMIIDNEGEAENETAKGASSSEWILCKQYEVHNYTQFPK